MPRSLTFFLSLSLFIISFLQIPIFAASFDCKKAETQTEKVICGDKELSQMDEDLSDIYFSSLLLKYSESDQEQKKIIKKIKQDQVDWIKVDQTSCEGNIACLKNIYSRRIESF